MLPIIDTHQHLWDLQKFDLPWTATSPQLNRSYLMRDYREAIEGQNVVKAVYMEVDVAPEQQAAEAEYVIDLCARYNTPTVAGVISGRPAADDFRAYIDRFQGSPYIKGVRQVLHGPNTPPGYCLQEAFIDGVRYLGENGLRFDICIRPGELRDAVKLVDQCSRTWFILDHCGNADPNIVNGSVEPDPAADDTYVHTAQQWRDDISALAKRPNIICKISGIVARMQPGNWTPADLAPTVNHCLDAFGPDRVIFGGDWPVCTLGASYAEWASALREIIRDRSEKDQRKLLHDNAQRFYGLS
jgi:predicted TIM-barrel fold metal-dependent hydrolase